VIVKINLLIYFLGILSISKVAMFSGINFCTSFSEPNSIAVL